jgi:hypothetical protein
MAAMMLWMGIGSTDFTRRIEASSQNVLQLMQRPGGYNAEIAPTHEGQESMGSGHAFAAQRGAGAAAQYRDFTFAVNSK